jgi:uncharacterized protein YdcH (DUF465 family)
MPNEWLRKNINPSLLAKYEKEMAKLRGEESHKEHIVDNIRRLNEEVTKIETDEERHSRELAEDEQEERRYQEQLKRERQAKIK